MTSRFRKSATVAALAGSFVTAAEGVRYVAYYDPPGIATICMGDTINVKITDVATDAECLARLDARLNQFSTAIDKCLPANLPEPSYVAYLSAAYNIGAPAFCGSSMARRTNEGNLKGGCDALLLWDKITLGGVKVALPGLKKRRAEERALCMKGVVMQGIKLTWSPQP